MMAEPVAVSFVDRVGVQAQQIRPLRAVLSVLAAPFYAVGFLVGLVVVVAVWVWAAAQVGFGDARRREETS